MSRIHGKDTSIEVVVRHWLFNHGYRYRKNVNSLPGKPDIVLRPYKTVIFIHGCFWHRHPGCKKAAVPKSHAEFWNKKFICNIANDEQHQRDLKEMGFRVVVIWECEINKHFDETMKRVVQLLGEPRHRNR